VALLLLLIAGILAYDLCLKLTEQDSEKARAVLEKTNVLLQQIAQQTAPTVAKNAKWDYDVSSYADFDMETKKFIRDKLNQDGDVGWEVVAVLHDPEYRGSYKVFLKRRKE